jgi:hypothetical protein
MRTGFHPRIKSEGMLRLKTLRRAFLIGKRDIDQLGRRKKLSPCKKIPAGPKPAGILMVPSARVYFRTMAVNG